MPAAPDFLTVYKHEMWLSQGLASLFTEDNIANYIPATAAASFKKVRARTEVFVVRGGVADNGHYVLDAQGNRRINGWTAIAHLTVVTDASSDIFDNYVAAVRNVCATVDQVLVNGDPNVLPYHGISRFWDGDCSPKVTPQEGRYEMRLTYHLIFGILPDACPGGLTNA